MTFLAELKRRNIDRAAAIYAGAAWLLVQIATQVFPFFDIANGVVRWIIVVLVVLFPFAMLFSWFYEWTPQGLQRGSEVDAESSVARRTGKLMDRWIIAILGTAVVLLVLNQFVLQKMLVDSGTEVASIAVLPMANSTGDPANEYISDGVSEDLIATLSRLSNLKVIGRTSSFKFRDSKDDSTSIGKQLDVGYLLEGSVRKSGEQLRIGVSLVKTADGSSVWGQVFDRAFEDIFAVQSEISATVAQELKVSLLGDNADTVKLASPNAPANRNPAAYQALLQANFYAQRNNPEDVRKGIAFLQDAIRLDPDYAMAHARLSYFANFLLTQLVADKNAAEAESLRALARSEAARALVLDPKLPEAHLALGQVHELIDLDIADAGADYARALQLAPNNIRVLNIIFSLQMKLGHFDAALANARKLALLEPLASAGFSNISAALKRLGRYDEAEASIRKALELQPKSLSAQANLAELMLLQGDMAGAIDIGKAFPDPQAQAIILAAAYFAKGDQAESDAQLETAIGLSEGLESDVAVVYAFRGEPDQMFKWLERGWASHDYGVLTIRRNPFLSRYAKDPRYLAFGRKIGVIGPDEVP